MQTFSVRRHSTTLQSLPSLLLLRMGVHSTAVVDHQLCHLTLSGSFQRSRTSWEVTRPRPFLSGRKLVKLCAGPSMVQLVVQHGGGQHVLEYDPVDGREVLQWQLFSLTGVEVHEQRIEGLFKDDTTEALCEGVRDGHEFTLISKAAGEEAAPIASQLASLSVDADAELARRLQEEEDAQLAALLMRDQQQPGPSGNEEAFKARLDSGIHTVMQYEDPLKQEKARAVIPLDELEERAAVALLKAGKNGDAAMHDALLVELLHWFKRSFQWVNAPLCDACGSSTVLEGMVAPTPSELAFGAARVEGYRCPACGAPSRFPRFNDPAKLLDTQRGRCGEWANAFTLCCRALGYEARWVLDWTDHVWAEVWSSALHRWVHCDPCEDRWDAPLLYEAGWGKQLSYVIAFWHRGVADVTRRYTGHWGDLRQRRSEVAEDSLARMTSQATARLRSGVTEEESACLAERDAAEQRELAQGSSPPVAPLPGRQTGSTEWRAARGELGTAQASTSGGSAAEERHGERAARDEHVGALWAALGAMEAAAASEDGNLEVASAAFSSHLSLVQAMLRALKALPWRARELAVAEGQPMNGRQLSAKGEAAYRRALTEGGGEAGMAAVGMRLDGRGSMLKLLPAVPAAVLALRLPVALELVGCLMAQVRAGARPPLYGCGPRLSGGYVSASGENKPAHQLATAAFDGVTATKWLVHGGHQGTSWLQYRCLHPVRLRCYWLTSAEDCPERDPASWTLEASTTGDTWQDLESREGIRFSARNERQVFEVPTTAGGAFTTFRFRFTSVLDAGAGCLQLSGVDLAGS